LNNLGNLYAELGELDKARDALTRTLAFDPDFAEAHNNMGKVHAAGGRLDEALRSIATALTLSPDYP
jgi:tetratricopeptide (TPR) repeat protein